MTVKRITGDIPCADCSRRACWEVATQRYSQNTPVTTAVMLLCDQCIGSLRSLLQWRHWDHTGHYKPWGWGGEWNDRFEVKKP